MEAMLLTRDSLQQSELLSTPVELGSSDTLKLSLITQDGASPKRAHQAFLSIKEPESGLETSYALAIKESGKAKLELVCCPGQVHNQADLATQTQKDLPSQFLASDSTLAASLVIGSFGSSVPYKKEAFSLKIPRDSSAPAPTVQTPERYKKLPEIHHIFKADPKSPPRIISLFFGAVVLVALPALLIAVRVCGVASRDC